MTQQIQVVGKVGTTVSYEDGMKVIIKRCFLTNTQNKKWFITSLPHFLEDSGCHTLQANGEADVLIVKTSISIPDEGDDTV